MMEKRAFSIESSVAALGGAFFGAGLLGIIGGFSGNAVPGALAGSLLGAVVGFFAYRGRIHRLTVGAIFYGLIGCVLGPGCDDYGGHGAIPCACIGAFIAWLGWRFLLTLPAACLGAIVFAREPELWIKVPIGFAFGGWFGTYVGAILERGLGGAPGVLVASPATPERDTLISDNAPTIK
jgi:hypothetical protein